MIGLLLLAALAAEPPREVRLDGPPSFPPADAHYPGTFKNAPVAHWSRPLPGRPVNAATHSERGRPVVIGERLLLGSAGGTGLFAISRRDGKLLQTYESPGTVESEPVLAGERIWFSDTTGTTSCYTLAGELIWRHQTTAAVPNRLLLDGTNVILRTVDDQVLALNRETGEPDWQYRRRPDVARISELRLYAAPEPALSERYAIMGFSDGVVVALDRRTGDQAWEARVGEGEYPDIVAPVTVLGGLVFASGYTGPLIALDVETGAARWRFDAGSASAAVLFERDQDRSPLLLHPGTDGALRAIDPRDGALLWIWRSGRGGALTSPLPTEAGLLIGSSLGVFAIVDPETGTTVWQWHEDRQIQGISVAPVVAGRQVFVISNAGRIYAMLSPNPDRPAPHTRRPTHRFRLAYPRDGTPWRDR